MSLACNALKVPTTEDLLPLSAFLHQQNVPHRIYEEAGEQLLMVASEQQAAVVSDLYQRWRDGEVQISLETRAPVSTLPILAQVSARPACLLLIALSLVGFALLLFNAPVKWLSLLTFQPFEISGGQVTLLPYDGAWWRWVTPAFLHFGWLHIVFNSLWLWELGGRVEERFGAVNFFALAMLVAAVSNAAQAWFSVGLFGGMSGVVYGLLGFCWLGSQINPVWQLSPPRSVMVLMVGWLVFCMVGGTELVGLGSVANAAHLAGLLCGAALGGVFAMLRLGDGRGA